DVTLKTFQEASRIIEAIKRGEVAAAMIWEPYVSYAERTLEWRVVIDGPSTVSSTHGYCLFARRDLIDKKPVFVRRVVANYSKCVRYAVDHLEDAAQSVYDRVENIALADIRRALGREARHWRLEATLDREFLARVVQELKHQSIVPPDFLLNNVLASYLMA